jgi:UDP-glucose 4-epimerase
MSIGPIWVTGAAGFLGQYVLQALVQRFGQGVKILGIGRGLTSEMVKPFGPLSAVEPDSLTSAGFDRLRTVSGPTEVVLHLAAGASVGRSFAAADQDFRNTVSGSAALYHWLGRHAPDARVVLASSAAVYGSGHPGPIRETAERHPSSPYGWHKKIVEDLGLCEQQVSGLRVLPARIFSVYGVGLRKQLFWDLALKSAAPSPFVKLMGTGAEQRDWCPVEDVAQTLVDLAFCEVAFENPICPVNIGSGRAVTVGEAARRFLECMTRGKTTNASLRFSGLRPAGDPASLVSEPTRLAELGLAKPRPFPARVQECGDWYRKELRIDENCVYPAVGAQMAGRPELPIQSGVSIP